MRYISVLIVALHRTLSQDFLKSIERHFLLKARKTWRSSWMSLMLNFSLWSFMRSCFWRQTSPQRTDTFLNGSEYSFFVYLSFSLVVCVLSLHKTLTPFVSEIREVFIGHIWLCTVYMAFTFMIRQKHWGCLSSSHCFLIQIGFY